MSVEYRGMSFPDYNHPVPSSDPEKKMMVLVRHRGEVRLVHFGDKKYGHNYSARAKADYLSRSAGIRDKNGNLTKDDPFSANYWARKVLWPDGPADGRADVKEASWEEAPPRDEDLVEDNLEDGLAFPEMDDEDETLPCSWGF